MEKERDKKRDTRSRLANQREERGEEGGEEEEDGDEEEVRGGGREGKEGRGGIFKRVPGPERKKKK